MENIKIKDDIVNKKNCPISKGLCTYCKYMEAINVIHETVNSKIRKTYLEVICNYRDVNMHDEMEWSEDWPTVYKRIEEEWRKEYE